MTALPKPEGETRPTFPDVAKYAFDPREGCYLLDDRTLNKDIFMDKSDCALLCLESNIEQKLIIFKPNISSDIIQNCHKIERKLPKIKDIVKNVDDPMKTNEAINELIEMGSKSTETNQRILGLVAGIFNFASHVISRPRWATVTSSDCSTITVRIRYSCTMKQDSGVSLSNFNNICGTLIPQGLIDHYSTSFSYNSVTYTVNILPVLNLPNYFARQFRIKHENLQPCGGCATGQNLFYVPISLTVDDDVLSAGGVTNSLHISEVAAHELGHEILYASRSNHILGYHWTATHKGTSTLNSNTLPTAPVWPPPPAIKDLMFYYNSPVGIDPANTFLAEEDAQVLVEKALFNYLGHCGQSTCQVCLYGLFPCKPGLFCNWLGRCSECRNDGDCGSDQYCASKLPGCKECRSKKPDGAWCLRDGHCINHCHLGRCTECAADSHCPADEYCKNLHIPAVTNICSERKDDGGWCDRPRMCKNHCHLLRCTECRNDNDCPSDKYCKNMLLPLIENHCKDAKPNGAVCTRGRECINFCDGARCAECKENWHCPTGKYCKWRNVFGVQNRCKNVCDKLCLVDSNCGHNGSGCDDCKWTWSGRRCKN